ncbi:MAG: 30S ribosomal protein S9 [Candidatus Shikimatogenerans sp. AspAUS03]|uniref:Small ribosomal subunit protein uS9 n=1 Tax=Candidatus Shikimatogenerans sp. AspAUS03 TaxID=3158563 RepID=A0AAU7QSW0_9FLAO
MYKNKHIVSKRKSTVARIYLKEGNNKFIINKFFYKDYFKNNIFILNKLYNFFIDYKIKINKYNLYINIYGGGINGQVEAIIYGLAKMFFKYKIIDLNKIKNSMLLRTDCRRVERKKFGKKKARKSFQFSKR